MGMFALKSNHVDYTIGSLAAKRKSTTRSLGHVHAGRFANKMFVHDKK